MKHFCISTFGFHVALNITNVNQTLTANLKIVHTTQTPEV